MNEENINILDQGHVDQIMSWLLEPSKISSPSNNKLYYRFRTTKSLNIPVKTTSTDKIF